VRTWLIRNEPTDLATVICHGDANLGNYLFDDEQVSAVVDWEMAFLARRNATHLPGGRKRDSPRRRDAAGGGTDLS